MSRRSCWFRLISPLALLATAAEVVTPAAAANPRSVSSWHERATGAGKYIVVLKPASGEVSASSVTASLSVSPNPNSYGQLVSFTGKGFNASETVSLSAAVPTPLTIGTGKTNPGGTVSIAVSGPAAIGGIYTATMAGGSGSSAQRAFMISPSVSLSTSSASSGSSVNIAVRGMQSNESYAVNYRVTSGAMRLCKSKATAASGGSSCTGKIPSGAAPGSGTFEVNGSKATFLSTPSTVRSRSAASAKTATPTPASTTTATPSASVTVSPTTPSVIDETATPTQTPIPESTETPTETPTATATETPTDVPTATGVSAASSPPAG